MNPDSRSHFPIVSSSADTPRIRVKLGRSGHKAAPETESTAARSQPERGAFSITKILSGGIPILRFAPCLFLLLLLIPLISYAQLAATPPMGWNSWDSYGLTITESEFKQNVDWFDGHLKPYGWKYVVVDEGWYLAHPENAAVKGADQGYTMDAYGRYMPAGDRFPSSANGQGFRSIADYVHSRGLKFGIHIIRGIPRQAVARNLPIAGSSFHAAEAANGSDICSWNPDNYGLKPSQAGQAYYDSLAKLYASWGVDFVKVDCIANPYKSEQIRMISLAIKKTGRPMVLSLSPGPTPIREADDVRKYAQMWRISNDFWDVWDKGGWSPGLKAKFANLAEWAPYAEIGHWPDADMLPIGYLGPRVATGKPRQTRFTPDEQRTLITLWSIARSPMMLGANLTKMDRPTEALLTNRELIAVNQHSTGNKPLVQTSQRAVWTARASSTGGEYVTLFNVSDRPVVMEYGWRALGIAAGEHSVRDLWLEKDIGRKSGLKVTLRPHASAIYRVK